MIMTGWEPDPAHGPDARETAEREWEAEVARSGKDPVDEYLNMARQHLDDSGAATRYALIAIAEALRDIRDVIKKR
jgi:hypothetical protein